MDAMAERFETLLRRFQLMSRDTPARFQQWLRTAPAKKRVFASFESVCTDMFPDQVNDCLDFPRGWIMAVACVALKHHILRQTGLGVELSDCGGALRVLDAGVAEQIPTEASQEEMVAMACRSSALEVKLAQLECRLNGILEEDAPPARKRAKRPLPEGIESVLVFLSESRQEALEALAALRKLQSAMRKQSESARMLAANAEISRLKRENEQLLRGGQKELEPQVYGRVLPKRALSMAGFWNLCPNDLLFVTPHLIEAVEERGGEVVRREGSHVCFTVRDRSLLVEAAVDTMAKHLPQYQRRAEGE